MAGTERRTDMAGAFAAARSALLALALLAFSLAAGARADDAPQPQPAATPSDQKPGAGGGGSTGNPPAAAEQHRLPPDQTTKQTLALPGRTLDFTAIAGSIPPFNDTGGAHGHNRPPPHHP